MTDLPEGYLPHDGGPCPVPLDSRPGVMFADGVCTGMGYMRAINWDRWWTGDAHNPGDNIIAYKPDPAFVEPEADAEAAGEPVAVIGKDWSLMWASADTLYAIVERTGIKIGSLLYTRPAPADPVAQIVAGLRKRAEMAREMAPDDLQQFNALAQAADWIERGDWKGTDDAKG